MSGMKFVVLGIAAGAFFVWTGMPQTGYQMNDQQLISNASLEDSSAQLEKAMALAANEYFDDALAILDDVVIENPNNSLALTIRGVMYRKIGRYSEAISTTRSSSILKTHQPIAIELFPFNKLGSRNGGNRLCLIPRNQLPWRKTMRSRT
jgi:hypothetical protein